jgi:hypothetical protein
VNESELELQLGGLAAAIEFPPTPDIAAAVRTRLEAPRRGRRPSRRVLAIAFAVLAVAVAGVLAVPSARTAILEWLGIKGVKLEFVDKLPPRAVSQDLDLGDATTLAKARRRAGFDVVAPPGDLGRPIVYFREPPDGGMVSFLYGRPGRVRLLLSEFRGEYRPYIHKMLSATTRIVPSRVDGTQAIWLEGAHFIEFADASGVFLNEPVHIANRVLLWRKDGLTYRLEGAVTRAQAIQIAEATT